MINNRQAGRRRGRGGNNGGGGGGGPRQGGGGRADNGNRIDSRARGNAAQLLEKYRNLAADAQRQGDRVNTEYYLQFADHYFRVIADQRGRFEDQQPRARQAEFDGESDDEYGDEGEPIRAGEQGFESRAERPDRGDRYEQRGERPDRQQPPRRADAERPRRWEGAERPARQPEEIAGQRRADPPLPGEDLDARAEAVLAADAPLQNDVAPRRRGRPRRDAVAAAPAEAPGGEPEAVGGAEFNGVDADRLPPSLGIAAANDAAGDDAPRPRRRRARPDEASAG